MINNHLKPQHIFDYSVCYLFITLKPRKFQSEKNTNKLANVRWYLRAFTCCSFRAILGPQREQVYARVFLFMESDIHIGQLIQSELRRQGRGITWFATQICCERTNVYTIFKRKSIDTELLLRISQVLDHDFFRYYTSKL